MEFEWPRVLLLIPLLLLFWLLTRLRPGRAFCFSASSLLPRHSGLRPLLLPLLPWLRLAALILLLIALARPRTGLEKARVQESGIVMEMLLDRSSSMTETMTFQGRETNRLGAAVEVFTRFLLGDGKKLEGRGADRIGLIAFAGFVDEIAPLSMDHLTLAHLAQTLRPAERSEDGTMIGDALRYAVLRLAAAQNYLQEDGRPIQSKVILLLTDGQQTQGGLDPIAAAQLAAKEGIKIYAVALAPEPRSPFGGRLFNFILPQLDTRLIEEAAQITGGGFFKAADGEELLEIYRQINELEKTRFAETFTLYEESFTLFVWPGLFLLFVELVLGRLYLQPRQA